MLRALGSLLLTILGFMLLGLIGVALFLLWSMGIGWLLIRFLPFTLFEASLLAMVASSFVAIAGWRMLSSMSEETTDIIVPETLQEGPPIPESRFFKTEEEKTQEAWFRYQFANDICLDLQDEMTRMPGKQVEELAIRLTDVVVSVLKKKRRAKRPTVTVEALKREMNQMGQKPYDEDLLWIAAESANLQLSYDEDLLDVVRHNRWNEPVSDW